MAKVIPFNRPDVVDRIALTLEEALKQICRRCGAAIDRRRVAADSPICEGCIQAEKVLRFNIVRKPLPGQGKLF
jgi:reverse gyrase